MLGMNETWRKERNILDRDLRPGAVMSYRKMMQEKTHEFIAQLRENPTEFCAHIESLVSHFLII